jgi:hypothetical protein
MTERHHKGGDGQPLPSVAKIRENYIKGHYDGPSQGAVLALLAEVERLKNLTEMLHQANAIMTEKLEQLKAGEQS